MATKTLSIVLEISDHPALEDFQSLMHHGESLLVEELWDAPKALLATLALKATGKNILILTGGVRESRLFDDFPFFLKAVSVSSPHGKLSPLKTSLLARTSLENATNC